VERYVHSHESNDPRESSQPQWRRYLYRLTHLALEHYGIKRVAGFARVLPPVLPASDPTPGSERAHAIQDAGALQAYNVGSNLFWGGRKSVRNRFSVRTVRLSRRPPLFDLDKR
jgi:hypothetical protein